MNSCLENTTALFQVGSAAEAIVQAISSILSNPNDVPSLTVTSVNVNGRSFYPSFLGTSPPNSKPSNGDTSSSTGLIVGLVVGLVVGAIVVTAIVLFLRYRGKMSARSAPYLVSKNSNKRKGQTNDDILIELPIQMLGSPTNYPLSPVSPRHNRRPHHLPPLATHANQ